MPTISGCSTLPACTGSPATGSVTVAVVAQVLPQPVITKPGDLTFNHTIGFTTPASTNVAVSITSTAFNDGTVAEYPWSAAATVQSPAGGNWLKINPTAGRTSNPTLAGQINSFAVTYDPTGLAPGTYNGTVTITVPNAIGVPATGNTVSFAVALVVNTTPAITVTPGSTTITGTVNGQAQTQTLQVTSTGARSPAGGGR